MRSIEKTLSAAIVIILISLIVIVSYYLIGVFSNVFLNFYSSKYAIPLMLCLTTIIVSIILARGIANIGINSVLENRRKHKAKLYIKLLENLTSHSAQSGEKYNLELNRDLVLWARKGVLDAYFILSKNVPLGSDMDSETKRLLERLITEMRRDLGHQDIPFTLNSVISLTLDGAPPNRCGSVAGVEAVK